MKTPSSVAVVILSAGEGTRLRPLSLDIPKVLCTVANVTLLRWILGQLSDQGFDAATVALPRSAGPLLDRVMQESPPGFRLSTFVCQESSRGTVGTLRQVVGSDSRPILVIYGDSLVAADFCRLVQSHARHAKIGGAATILYHRPLDLRCPDGSGRTYHGVMSVDSEAHVTEFVEKPTVNAIRSGFELANAAVFVVEKRLMDDPLYCDARDFSYHVFEPAIKEGIAVFGMDIGEGFRFDVGDLSRYHELNMLAVRGMLRVPWSEDPRGDFRSPASRNGYTVRSPVVVGKRVVFGRGAIVGPDAVVGDNCRIGMGASVSRSVLMDGSRIGEGAEVDGCVLGPRSEIAPHSVISRLVCSVSQKTMVPLAETACIWDSTSAKRSLRV